jgi:hypothetical protein
MSRPRKERDENDIKWVERTERGLRWLFKRLEEYHGVSEIEASDRLHEIKERCGIPADVHPPMDRRGTIFSPAGWQDPETREEIGTLQHPPGSRKGRRRR